MNVGELAKHQHEDVAVYGTKSNSSTNHRQTYNYDIVDSSAKSVITGLYGGTKGSNEYHNNVAPCVAAYMWKRTV